MYNFIMAVKKTPDETLVIQLDPPELELERPTVAEPTFQDDKTDPQLMRPTPVVPPVTESPRPAPSINAPPPPVRPKALARMPELGVLDEFMKDPEVSEIMVNDLRNVMIEKAGKITFSGFAYSSIDELNRLVRSILDVTGRVLSPDSPYVDGMLPDGSRINIVGPPITLIGPCITIRKFPARPLGIEDLLKLEMMDRRMAHFLSLCVMGRMNIVVSGGTGCGKSTLLNALMAFIPKGERVITIEDTPELTVQHFNSVRMQTKAQTPTSAAVTARDLLANSLRMRPDRIIIGECRRSEAFDMLQAMNTGHEGSMSTLHSNSPRDALSRLETLCMTAGLELPLLAIRKQVQSAIDLIVQIKRFRNGKRRVVAITEVTGMEGETLTLQDLFLFEHDPVHGASDRGAYKSTGLMPQFVGRLREQGIEFPRGYFS